jgi:hypothetical protein
MAKESLSVCIICQDEVQTLPHTLLCVETLRPVIKEVVFVDGGSVDGTLDFIQLWTKSSGIPVTLLKHPYDCGGWQKNRGLELCTGEWVFNPDADMPFTNNLLGLFEAGYFDSKILWSFQVMGCVLDEFHFVDRRYFNAARLWKNGFRYVRPWHEELPLDVVRNICPEVWFFENSLLQTKSALLRRGERWQKYAAEISKAGPTHGSPTRYLDCEVLERTRPITFHCDNIIAPRDSHFLRMLDNWRELERQGMVSGEPPVKDWL